MIRGLATFSNVVCKCTSNICLNIGCLLITNISIGVSKRNKIKEITTTKEALVILSINKYINAQLFMVSKQKHLLYKINRFHAEIARAIVSNL